MKATGNETPESHLREKTPTSLAIGAEIEKARAEYAVVKRGAALAGLSAMSDAEHIKAEAEYQAQRRATDRAEARVADLGKAHAEALAAEAEAEKRAETELFRQRIEARHAVEIEAAELLAEYDQHASAIADALTRLDAINAEANAVIETGRHTPGFEPAPYTDIAHCKRPDRSAGERREKRPCWVFEYSASRTGEISSGGRTRRGSRSDHQPRHGQGNPGPVRAI